MIANWEDIVVLPLALTIDLAIGEYPVRLHPVVWIGWVISLLLKPAPRRNPAAQLIYGAVIVVLAVALFAVPLYFLLDYLNGVSTVAYIAVAALLLKSTFSIKELGRAARRVERCLVAGEIGQARKEVSYLVSRDTRELDSRQINSAVVEMTAESTTDGIVAPVFYWLLLGVPGAIAYRVVNTFDSRIGYHGQYEYLGKFAARLDDVLNYIPARLSGLLLVASAYLNRLNGGRAWRVMLQDRDNTESSNAGWTMSAVAGALGVRLEKPGCYRVGSAGGSLAMPPIAGGYRLVVVASLLWFAIGIGIAGVCYAVAA